MRLLIMIKLSQVIHVQAVRDRETLIAELHEAGQEPDL